MLLRPWGFLGAAVSLEVAALTSMKFAADHHSAYALLTMYSLISLAFYFFSIALKEMPIALAYATWETCGLLLITLVSITFLGELISVKKIAGMSLLVLGVIMVNVGAKKKQRVSTQSPSTQPS